MVVHGQDVIGGEALVRLSALVAISLFIVDRCAGTASGLDQHLGEGRVGVHRHRDLGGSPLQQPRQRRLGEEVARMGADQVRTEQEAGLRIGDELGEAVHLAHDGRLAERPERERSDLDGVTGIGGLGLGHSDRCDLGTAEGDARHEVHPHRLRVGPAIDSTATSASWLATWASAKPGTMSPMAYRCGTPVRMKPSTVT
jgi:hypothetical protein